MYKDLLTLMGSWCCSASVNLQLRTREASSRSPLVRLSSAVRLVELSGQGPLVSWLGRRVKAVVEMQK